VAEFVGLFVEFVEDAVSGVPVEADTGGFAGELKSFEERGQRAGDAVEKRLGLGGLPAGSRRYEGFGGALLSFDDFPVAEDFGGVFSALGSEDVGMAANHFLVDFADDVGDVEAAFFAGNLRVEENLEEKVAEFFGEFGVVGAIHGIEDFVGFFDEIRAECGVCLFAIPGAAFGGTEASHDGNEFFKGGAHTGRGRFVFARGGDGAFGGFSLEFAGGHEPFQSARSNRNTLYGVRGGLTREGGKTR
jgi:hypothetical protein